MPNAPVTAWAVVTFPVWGKDASVWLDAIRHCGDPYAGRIAAHVTLMYPTPLANPDALRERLRGLAARTAPFHATFDRLGRMDDPFHAERRHLSVLVPDASGAAHLAGLHSSIANTPAAYEPHVTIGRFAAADEVADFERRIGSPSSPLRGRIDAVELVRLSGADIVVEARFPFLAGGA